MLDKDRLKNKFKAAFAEQAEADDANAATDRICDKMAQAIVDEIKQLTITYTNGLGVPNVGIVTGSFDNTLT
jgi:hypothetical protein